MTPSRLVLGLALLVTGCPTPDEVVDPRATDGTTENETTSSTMTADASPSTTSSTTSTSFETTSSTTDDGVGVSFILDLDNGPSPFECSVVDQDCPRGEKCNAWNNDGGSAWNAMRCFPVDPDPDAPGEPCTVQGSGVSGIDSCDVGSMCWDPDGRTMEGYCVAYCIGGPAEYTCADPNAECSFDAIGILFQCFPQCDPLDPTTCIEGRSCYLLEHRFFCARDEAIAETLGPFETCDSYPWCDEGLHCGDADTVGQCDIDAPACCTPYCDVTAPDCPPGTQCIPYYARGEGAPLHANLGICGQDPA